MIQMQRNWYWFEPSITGQLLAWLVTVLVVAPWALGRLLRGK